MEKGYIQIYTGNGKGKTTAALGVALRAAGIGMNTFIMQFMKEFPYSELNAFRKFTNLVRLEQYGGEDFIIQKRKPNAEEIQTIRHGFERAKEAMLSGKFDIVVLDEICVCLYYKMLKNQDLIDLFHLKPQKTELIVTGRYCPNEILANADLITEMKEVRHYYQKGVISRPGIDC